MYPILKHIPAVVFSLTIAGCVSLPLNTQSQKDRLADTIGVEPEEITFMNYCFFEVVSGRGFGKELPDRRGIVTLTGSEFCLVDGVLKKAPKDYFLKVPVSEIEGVSRSTDQILVRHEGKLIVLFVYNWNDLSADESRSASLYDKLIFAGVPGFESSTEFRSDRLTPTPKLIPYSQQEAPYDPYKFPDP